jgi:phosphoribosylanthranilate isomerase
MLTGTRVKICGITRVDDARHAAAAGADALGLIFYPPSPRSLHDLQLAKDIAVAVGPFVTVTALFVNPEPRWVDQVLTQVPVGLLQFHGDESPAFCESFARPYMKALRMKPGLDVKASVEAYPNATAVLLDAYSPGCAGGTGETFDWDRVPAGAATPIVLAGGLTPDNVADAVARVKPYGVDVSGGVEASSGGQPAYGIKDSEKVAAFVRRAKCGEDQ